MGEINEVKQVKKNTGLIVMIIILAILVLGLGGFIVYDKVISNKSLKKTNANDNVSVVDNVEITIEEENIMKKVSELVFTESDKSNFDELDIQKKMNIALQLSGKGIDKVTGTELSGIIKKHFGNDQNIEITDYKCPAYAIHHTGDDAIWYKYNKETDKFVYNPAHGGHGSSSAPVVTNLAKDKILIKSDEYHYTVKAYYYENVCIADTCGPTDDPSLIYKTYNDANAKTNYVIDALANNNINSYCLTDYTGVYSCDYDRIVNDVKDKLYSYTFVFKKEGANLVYKGYSKK